MCLAPDVSLRKCGQMGGQCSTSANCTRIEMGLLGWTEYWTISKMAMLG